MSACQSVAAQGDVKLVNALHVREERLGQQRHNPAGGNGPEMMNILYYFVFTMHGLALPIKKGIHVHVDTVVALFYKPLF